MNNQQQKERIQIWAAIAILLAIGASIMAIAWSIAFNVYLAGQMGFLEFAVISVFSIVLAIGAIALILKVWQTSEAILD